MRSEYETAHIYGTEDIQVPLLQSAQDDSQGSAIHTILRAKDMFNVSEDTQVQNKGLEEARDAI